MHQAMGKKRGKKILKTKETRPVTTKQITIEDKKIERVFFL